MSENELVGKEELSFEIETNKRTIQEWFGRGPDETIDQWFCRAKDRYTDVLIEMLSDE